MSYVSSITVKPAQTTTSTRRPIVSLPKQIPIQSLLYKTTTCLTRSATTCLSHKWKKTNCLKQPLQNFILRRNGKQWIKIKVSPITFTLLLLYNAVCLMFIKTGHLHLTYIFPINVVIRALNSQSRSTRLETAGRLQGQLILSSFRDWLNEYEELLGGWVVKSKLSPRSGSVALRQMNPIHKEGL